MGMTFIISETPPTEIREGLLLTKPVTTLKPELTAEATPVTMTE